MFTVVPKAYLNQRVAAIRKVLYRMDAFVILFILLGVGLVVQVFEKQRKETMRLAYTDPLTGGANYAKFCLVLNRARSLRLREG